MVFSAGIMLSRKTKAAYFGVMRVPMFLSGRFYRALLAPRSLNVRTVKVQLGPGQKNYLPGWINVDANFVTARCDVWANIQDSLPFPDLSVDVFYSHHVIEHIPDRQLVRHFADMHRCLKPGGLIRIGGPNGDMAMRKYLSEDSEWLGNFTDPHESIGGKLKNFILCRNEHLTILTPSYLREIALLSGYESAIFCTAGQSTTEPDLIDSDVLQQESWSSPNEPHTIIVECRKTADR